MPDHAHVTVTGKITDVFAHRFVVETERGRILADLTPKGAERIALKVGETVTLAGEMKPSELKVERFTAAGRETVRIDHGKPHQHGGDVDPGPALQGAQANGYTVLGRPRRKPKHFEILGRDRAGALAELHVELDGTLRKTKPIDASDAKWAGELQAS